MHAVAQPNNLTISCNIPILHVISCIILCANIIYIRFFLDCWIENLPSVVRSENSLVVKNEWFCCQRAEWQNSLADSKIRPRYKLKGYILSELHFVAQFFPEKMNMAVRGKWRRTNDILKTRKDYWFEFQSTRYYPENRLPIIYSFKLFSRENMPGAWIL